MNKIYLLLIACLVSVVGRAQVTGTKTIGTDYATLAAAISALNTSGISGAVTINVPGGYTETAPTGGFVLGSATLNASMSSTNTLTIQKSGSGSNPLLTGQVGTTNTNDGIFIIQGTDYVTINGLNLVDTSTLSMTEQIEWGYALVKQNNTAPFDGCRYVTIQNCTITLNKLNTSSVGIYSGNHIATDVTALTITSTSDALSNCTFKGNTITNVNRCISLNGFAAAASPYTLYDQNNTIGGTSSTDGNTLSEFGGSGTAGYGIYLAAQNNAYAGYNSITSTTTPGTANIYGIFHGVGNNSSFTAANNTLSLTLGSSGAMYGIANGNGTGNSGVSGTSASFTVRNNTFQNYNFTATNATLQYGLCVYNQGGTTSGWDLGSLKITGNTVQNMALNATSTHYLFYNNYCNTNDARFMDNKISGVRRTGTAGSTYGYYNYYGYPTGGSDSVVRNKITNSSAPATFYGFYNYLPSTAPRNRIVQYDTLTFDTCGINSMYSTLYGIYAFYGNNQTITNNYLSDLYATPSNYGYLYGYYLGYGNTQTVSNNIFKDCMLGYYLYGYYAYGSTVSTQFNNNLLSNIQWPAGAGGGGYAYCNYFNSSGTYDHYNNVFRNINATVNTQIYVMYNLGGTTMNIYNDSVYNISTNNTSSYYIYGYYQSGGTTVNLHDNFWSNLNSQGSFGNTYGLYFGSATALNVYSNVIDSVVTSNATNTSGLAYGIYQSSGSLFNCYKNKISYIMANGTNSSVNGIYANAGTQTIYNNLIGNLQLPNSTSTTGTNLVGLYLGTSTTGGYKVSYNTIVLNATSTGASFSSSALYWGAASSGYPLTLKNNIIVNTSGQAGTGYVSAMRWNTASTTYYNNYGSNNNLFYAGTPGTYRALLYNVSTNYQTLSTLKPYVTPADGASVTESPTFQNLVGIGTDFLKPSTTVPTQIEGNGVNITGITNDHYGVTRAGNTGYSGTGVAPDLGAVEGNYTANDINAPVVGMSALPFSCGTGDRTFTATITDVTGVPTTGTLVPRVYFKKGAAGTWYSNAGTLSSGTSTSGTWSFTITSSTMGGLVTSDVVYYFIIAQDVAGTPNIGSSPSGAVATNVNTVTTYPTGLNYTVANALSGTITVGSGGTYATLTAAATAYNSSCISGNVVYSLISSSYPSETFPITFNANIYASASNTLTIKPAVGVAPTISGSVSSSGLIKLNGADYITIDGSNTASGTTKDLTLQNNYTSTGAVVWNSASGGPGNGADYNTIKNVNIIGGTNTSTQCGVFSGGTSLFAAGDDNKSLTIQNCNIQKTYYGIMNYGSAAFPATNTQIIGDSIGSNTAANYCLYYGMYLYYNNNTTVSQNTIFNMKSASSISMEGIYIGPNNNNLTITRNTLTGFWNTYGSSYGVYGIDLASTGGTNITISNNMISDFIAGGYGTVPYYYYYPFGIRLLSTSTNLKVYDNTINFSGNVTNPGSGMFSACIMMYAAQPGMDMRGNILSNTLTSTMTGKGVSYATYQTGLPVPNLDYNDYYGTSSTNVNYYISCNGTSTTYATLPDWQAAIGQNAHSLSVAPLFVSANDNHLVPIIGNGPLVSNTPIAGVTVDFDGTTRSAITPVMGAHEVNIPPTVLANPTSLTFSPTTTSTYSAPQYFIFTGSFLTATGTLTVTATTAGDFQVSTDGVTWSTSYTIPYTGGAISDTVFVRFHPTAVITYTGNVAITGGGLVSATNVTLNGTGANLCSGTPVAGTAAITPGIGGPTTPFSLTLTGSSVVGGLNYQWQSSATGTAGSFTNIPGATTTTYNFTGIAGGTFYQAVVTCPSYTSAMSNTVAATYSTSATYTGTIGTYVVPAGTTNIRIQVKGAQGGGSTSYAASGGLGAIMQGDFCVTPGQVLKYIVGQHPADANYSGGGGGGSFVWDSATGTPLIIAGGGGGAGYKYPSPTGGGANATTGPNGTESAGNFGSGGFGTAGSGGTIPTSFPSTAYYGAGGTGWLSAGNTAYSSCGIYGQGGSTPLAGGAGGAAYSSTTGYATPGGFGGGGGATGCSTGPAGGGGGYSGGAGGLYLPSGYYIGAGGGGSYNNGYNQVNSVGNLNNGVVNFTVPPTALAAVSSSTLTFPATTAPTGYSPAQTTTVTATGLAVAGTLSLTPTAGFEVSFNGTTWCSVSPCTSTVTSSCGTITLYVRSHPSAVGTYTGTATLSGGNLGTPIVITLNGNGASACSGTPVAGTTISTPASVNSTTSYTLSDTGTTVAGDLGYQWQSSLDSFTWTNISGATNATLTLTGLTANTYYRSIVACGSPTGTNYSVPVLVNLLPPAAACVPSPGSWYYEGSTYIAYGANNFSVTGYSGSTLADVGISGASNVSTGYLDRTTLTPILAMQQGGVYPASVTKSSSTSYNDLQVWIDLDNDGSFSVAEEVSPVSGWSTGSVNPVSFNISIPYAATAGLHRMRIRVDYEYSAGSTAPAHIDPCGRWFGGTNPQYYGGTITDYFVNIVPLPMCSGTPTAGTASSTPSAGCGTFTPNLTISGATITNSGLSYQWQSSPDGATWADVAGATNASYAPSVPSTIYYRRGITCAASAATAYTAGMQVTVNPVPAITSGPTLLCVGSTGTFTPSFAGGTWTSSNSTIATVGASTGVATGAGGGSANISYTISATGCYSTAVLNVSSVIPTVTVSATPAVICSGETTSLSATLTSTLPGYNQSSIPYAPVTFTPTGTFNSSSTPTAGSNDDGYFTVTLPFNFTFFGTNYTSGSSVYIGTNGYLTFGSGTTTTTMGSMPSGSFPATIAMFARDLYMATSGTITYGTVGTAPNRQFIVSYNNIADFSAGPNETGQIVLYEGSNTVDLHVTTAQATFHTLGIQSASGASAFPVPGQNYTSTAVTNSSWRFAVPVATYAWSPATSLGSTTGNSVTATNLTATPSITYSVTSNYNGCSYTATKTVTVNPLPAAITGTAVVCEGLSTSLSTPSTGGTWTSGSVSTASVGSTTGVVTGGTAGIANISYSYPATGCKVTQAVTVNPVPGNILGTPSACVGATSPLSDATSAGVWSSGTTAIATIGSTDAILNGVSAGLAIITYMLPTGCLKTVEATINPLPVTTITPATVATVCAGDETSFTAFAPQPSFSILLQDFNSGLGTWTVTNASGTTASYWQLVTSTYSGATGDGTQMLESAADATGGAPTETILTSPSFSTMGYGSATVSFNEYLISLSSSDALVDVEYTADGFNWYNVNSQVGEVVGSGAWSASSPEVSVNLPSGALGQPSVKLRWHYYSNWGLYWDIDNIKVTAFQPPVSYVWTGVSGATGLSCAACGTTTITPGATGANVYSVTSTTSSGCTSTDGVTVNVNPLPSAITGTMEVCVNATTTMTDADAGGTWSSADATVSVDLSTGEVTGVSAGTALVTYTLPTGCRNTAVVTVNPLPATTTGIQDVCEGLTTTLSNSTTGGTWSSSFPSVADVDASGVVSGYVAGNADIYYTLTSTGCRIAANVTVNPTPQPITGIMQVCEASTTALSDADAGGTWASGTTSVATVDATTGVVTGVVAGASVITYQLPTGCINTATVTVNAVPATITGALQVCQGLTTTLDNATTGGTWSTASADASVDAMGVVTGINAGVATVTYQLATSCVSTADVTVNPTPAAIGGTPQVCIGLTTALTDADAGGTWASGSTGIATVDPTTGVVTGVVSGTSTITYQLPTGCINTTDVTVDPTPAAITGILQVCEGLSTTLSNTDPGGAWSTGAFSVSVDASGIVTAYTAGVATITYQLPTGCINTADVTVNPTPAAISGSNQVCEGLTAVLANSTGGGSWSSSMPSVASIDASGTVYGNVAGNSTITYALPATGCLSTMDMTVNPAPAAITGTLQVCEASTTNLASATAGGTWSSGAFMTASVDATGIVSGISAGTAPITYMLATGCQATAQVTVNPLPAAITGTKVVCENANTTLYNTTSGGAWTSGATGTATVASGTGVVTGVSAGNANITYTLPTGCISSTQVTVNPNPTAIAGTPQVCVGLTTALSSTSTGGTWTSSVPGVASVTSSTGVVTGVAMGSARITYTLPTSCKTTAMVTVNPLPAPIAGSGQVCAGSIGLLTDGSAGGTWASSTPAVATIDAAGNVDAIAAGTTLVTYTLPTGCIRTRTVVVNPLPAAISGTMQVCQSSTTTLSNTTTGGVWSTSAPITATINVGGVVTGGTAGTATVSYTLPTGCRATDVVTVNQMPSVIAGTPNACEGSTTALSNTVAGGTWASSVTTVATIDGTTGVVNGLTAGSTVITYELPTGCKATRTIVINPQPTAIVGTPQVCYGATTTFSNAVSGGIWTSSNTAVANAGLTSGVVTGLATGTVNVSYTLMTGCSVSTAVVVDPLPAAITGSLNVCNGQTSALGSTTSGGTWTSSNPAIADVSTTGVVSGMTPGNAVVTYALATGCKRASIVTVNALPVAQTVVGGGDYCTGGAGVHIGLSGSNSGINYQLYNGTAPSGTPVTGITGLPLDFGLVMPAGTYSVVARNAATGCASDMTGTVAVVVNPVLATALSIVTPSDVVCEGSTPLYTASIVNGGTTPTYQWKVNGTPIPGATNATYTYTPGNGDVVTSMVTSSAPCAFPANASASRTMTVNANEMPVASVITTSGPALCEGNTATFNVSSLYGGTSPVFTWLKNGAVAGTGATFAYVPANGDNISVKMNSNYSCRLADSVTSPAVTMMTSPVYIPAITISSNYGFFVNENTNVTLTATVASGGPAPSYQWSLNGTTVAGATSATYSKVFNNGDSVSCQVTGSGLCGMSAFNSVVMRVGPTSVATTSVGNMNVQLMPNPNKGEFSVKGNLTVKEDKEVAIEVTNMLGQVVYRTNVIARNGEVDTRIKLDNTLANGMYMLNMISGEDRKVFHFVLEQ